MLRVTIDTSPLSNGNKHRGVGAYTRFLLDGLRSISNISIVESDPDIIHYPYFDLFFSTLPIFRKTNTVVTIHDLIPLVFPKKYPMGKKGFFNFFRQRIALKSVKAIITDSESSKRDIVRLLKVDPENVHVVYLAANPALKAVSSSTFQNVSNEYKLPQKYILYVGDINYNKNITQLIKALKYLPDDIHLVCVGKNFIPHSIPEWTAIEVQMTLSNVQDRVRFIHSLKSDLNQDLAAFYSGSICYVQPALYEGFGLPVLEAMKCRTPVVCSHNSSLIEIGGDVVQFVDPTAESISDGVKIILNLSVAERSLRVKKAEEWAARFSWEKVARETALVYQHTAEKFK